MNRHNYFKASILSVGLSLLLLPLAHAADVLVLVYGEHSGTDIVYHYTLVNNGAGKMMDFHLGVKEIDPGYDAAYGTLSRLPTGTAFIIDPDIGFSSGSDLPIPSPASVTSPAQPPGWSVKIGGYKEMEGSTKPNMGLAILWKAPQPIYGGPVNVTGADAGQTLSGFSVRVPATGPGSLEKYLTGDFMVRFWLGESWLGKTVQHIFAPLEKQDTLPPTLSVSVSPTTLWSPNKKFIPITATITVKDDFDSAPEIKLESINANEPLDKEDIKDAQIGTDDRQFKLKAEREGKNKAGRIYTVTYSATDATGNKTIATATVVVPHDERKKDD